MGHPQTWGKRLSLCSEIWKAEIHQNLLEILAILRFELRFFMSGIDVTFEREREFVFGLALLSPSFHQTILFVSHLKRKCNPPENARGQMFIILAVRRVEQYFTTKKVVIL
jgi:hypothetical protein